MQRGTPFRKRTKTCLRFVITDLLELLLVSVALVGIGSFGAVFAQTGDQLRTWSAVGSTCIPDDETPDTRYDVQVDGGYIEFKANVIGYNYF